MMTGSGSRFLPRKGINDVNRAIRRVVSHAGKNVPFYRDAFHKAGVFTADILGIDDLPVLPITDRLDLMTGGPSSYLRQGADALKLTVKHTTGTTGTKVMIHMNFMEQAFRKLTLLDSLRRNAKLTWPFELVDVGPEQKDQSTKVFPASRPGKNHSAFPRYASGRSDRNFAPQQACLDPGTSFHAMAVGACPTAKSRQAARPQAGIDRRRDAVPPCAPAS
jgi:hypothetical protein